MSSAPGGVSPPSITMRGETARARFGAGRRAGADAAR